MNDSIDFLTVPMSSKCVSFTQEVSQPTTKDETGMSPDHAADSIVVVAIAKVSTRSNGSAHARTSQSSIIGMADALVAKFEVRAYKVESETLITLAFDFVDVNPELGN